MGIDVAGLTEASGYFGIWDNFQCKHYDSALAPSDALPEIGKMLWHSFRKEFSPPRCYRFMAPKGCGISLQKMLLKPATLREKLFEKWDDWCAGKITSTQTIKLEGAFRAYCEEYNYSSFTYRNPLEVIDEHRLTPYFSARFGGGLAARPAPGTPPAVPEDDESRYLHHLFGAYGDNKKTMLAKVDDLGPWPDLMLVSQAGLANSEVQDRCANRPALQHLHLRRRPRLIESGGMAIMLVDSGRNAEQLKR
jgi:hypothetical protein